MTCLKVLEPLLQILAPNPLRIRNNYESKIVMQWLSYPHKKIVIVMRKGKKKIVMQGCVLSTKSQWGFEITQNSIEDHNQVIKTGGIRRCSYLA